MKPEDMAALHAIAMETRGWSAAEFTSLIESGAFVTGDTRAFALAHVVHDEAELLTIATHPGHRRLGLGRAALDAVHAEAARRGATRVFLEVASGNRAAQALYKTAGYREVGRRRGYYQCVSGVSDDAIVMVRDLPAD